jgi:hypothetical protein
VVDIPRGTRLLCVKPLLIAESKTLADLERHLATQLKSLPKAALRTFLTLHNNYPGQGYPFNYTFKTNALPYGPDSPIGAVYPTTCLINHSCIPNAHNNWDDQANHETIYAIHPISAGEEISIAYDAGGPSPTRLASSLLASDTRRQCIQSLDAAIGNSSRMLSKPQDALRDCQTLLRVLEDEYNGYAGVLGSRVYYDAFQISIAHGDQARANIFAERSMQYRVVCEGEDSPEAKRMKGFVARPASHGSFWVGSRKWKTVKGLVSKGLDEAELEEWLWGGKVGGKGGAESGGLADRCRDLQFVWREI